MSTAPTTEAEENPDANAAVTPELEFGTETAAETVPDTVSDTAAAFDTSSETRSAAPDEKLPDDIPAEGFYELLYDLDEMMKLGII